LPKSCWGKKKELWPEAGKAKMSLEAREIAEREVTRMKDKTGLSLETVLRYAGISERT
jgi:hypothetical protein